MSSDESTSDTPLEERDPTELLPPAFQESFDRYTRLVAGLLRVPVGQLNLVTATRQLTRSGTGGPRWSAGTEADLSHSYCKHVVASGEALAVEDARSHPLVAENRATVEEGIQAYLGFPIEVEGRVVATLCGVDFTVRQWTSADLAMLEDLAAGLKAELELRLEVERLRGAGAG